MKFSLIFCLALAAAGCSAKDQAQQAVEQPVKTYHTLRSKTDSIQAKAQEMNGKLDSLSAEPK